jgi:GNAT superfamily N-acetyltransferase
MTVFRVETDEQILSTRDVMLQLRPDVAAHEYVATVRRMSAESGYRLVAAEEGGVVRAVGGYRVFEMLYCPRMLSIDDLVTDEQSRSAGAGRELIVWFKAEAERLGCTHIHLDSRVHRSRAHRFYFREGFAIEAFHFILPVQRS